MHSKVKKQKSPDLFEIENGLLAAEHAALQSGVFRVAGVDEAGRGPLAGPVVAAAVMFPSACLQGEPADIIAGIQDSKVLSAKKRAQLLPEILQYPGVIVGVGCCDSTEIDQLNILRATHLAMRKALLNMKELPGLALVDGLPVQGLPTDSRSMIKGDRRCFSIAAASIVAKETRDSMMKELDLKYPEYGFAQHKGYGTRKHITALEKWGPCPIHRRSFAPVRVRETLKAEGHTP
ncbi:ribonuclease HII [Kiritimatiellaeota bacterium B1221]|nr:ribonuclease HII [Kiritimatiellaeota bacterium B1221]